MRAVLAGIAASVLVLSITALPAVAAEVDVDSPVEVTVGDDVSVTATITADGEPVAGAEMALAFLGRVLGESGWVVVARAISDEAGVVTFDYQQRSLDGGRMRVEYFGPDGQENTEFTLGVVDGPQLQQSDVVDLPIFGVWWILTVLAIIWCFVVLAVVRLVHVGRASDLEAGPVKVIPRMMVSFVVFTALGMFVVVMTKPQSHANLDPTADFGRVPHGVVGVEAGYAGLGRSDSGTDHTGEQLFVEAGCASCHGVGGRGAVVGVPIAGEEDAVRSVASLLEEVREGPKGMPAYDESQLSDDEVSRIFAFLEAVDDP